MIRYQLIVLVNPSDVPGTGRLIDHFFIMNHPNKKVYGLILSALLVLSLITASCSERIKDSRPRPNFILIVTDDQDADSLRFMPKTQRRVIEKGITFTNAYVTSSACAPSRGSILTGRYPRNTGITKKYQQLHGINEEKTIATILHKAGYRNILLGKYVNQYGKTHPKYIPKGWDEWHAMIDENKYYNYRINENGEIVQYGDAREDYITDVVSTKAAGFLDSADKEKPFFLFINTVAPHTPSTPAPEYNNEFNNIPISYSFEDDISDKPKWVQNFRMLNESLIRNYFGNSQKMEDLYRNRWRTLLSVDDMIDNIMSHLEKNGLLGNTYLFLVSDNGDGLTKHIPVSAKLSPYDEGIRVPFIAMGPSIQGNIQVDNLVSTVDILPTLADLAGVKSVDNVDGRSLVPLLTNSAQVSGWRESIFAELPHIDNTWPWKSTPPSYQLMRTQKFKYIEYETGEREYYDLVNDPNEMENLYNTLSPETQTNLSLELRKLAEGRQ